MFAGGQSNFRSSGQMSNADLVGIGRGNDIVALACQSRSAGQRSPAWSLCGNAEHKDSPAPLATRARGGGRTCLRLEEVVVNDQPQGHKASESRADAPVSYDNESERSYGGARSIAHSGGSLPAIPL